jgi:hypothetical protein
MTSVLNHALHYGVETIVSEYKNFKESTQGLEKDCVLNSLKAYEEILGKTVDKEAIRISLGKTNNEPLNILDVLKAYGLNTDFGNAAKTLEMNFNSDIIRNFALDPEVLSAFIDADIPILINNDMTDHAVALHRVIRTYENGKLTSFKIQGMNPNGGTGYTFRKVDIRNSRPYAIIKKF